jgi:hypothetical protein
MLSIILILVACVVSLFWLGPWLVVLIGGKPFIAVIAILAIALAVSGLWLWLAPLPFALIGATIAGHWMMTRR